MPQVDEIVVNPTQDPNIVVYNTRFEMSSGPEVGCRGSAGELGAFGNLMLEISGVVQVHVHSYMLLITKAPLFSWDEIRPRVEIILKEFATSQRQLKDVYDGKTVAMGRIERRRTPSPRTFRKS